MATIFKDGHSVKAYTKHLLTTSCASSLGRDKRRERTRGKGVGEGRSGRALEGRK